MSQRALKSAWHLLLVAAAVTEFRTSKTPFRRLLTGACAGWHLAAAYDDWFHSEVAPNIQVALDSFDVGYQLGRIEESEARDGAASNEPEQAMGVMVKDPELMQKIFDQASEGEA